MKKELTKELKLWSNEPFDVELFLPYSHHSCLVQFLHRASRGRSPIFFFFCPVLDRFLPTLAWTIKINEKRHSRLSIPHDLWQHVVLDNWTRFVSSSTPETPNLEVRHGAECGASCWEPFVASRLCHLAMMKRGRFAQWALARCRAAILTVS